jgi:threonine/homoserine/homoserine lactone efflux protein
MSIKSVICWVYGLAFLIIPVQILSIYGVTISQDGEMTVRLFGASFVLLAMWLGLERDTSEVSSMRAVAISVAVGDLLGCAIMVYYLLTGTGNILGWFNALLYLLLAIGFGYTLVTEPKGKLAI